MASVRSLLEKLPVPCGATNRRGRVLWVNAAAARLHGSTPAKLVGADIRSLWPHAPVPAPRVAETKVEHAVVNGRAVWLRICRVPMGRSIVAISEEVTDSVELGATRALASLIARPLSAAPMDRVSRAVGRAFAEGAAGDDVIAHGMLPVDLYGAAMRLMV